jgi:hypothetical protein
MTEARDAFGRSSEFDAHARHGDNARKICNPRLALTVAYKAPLLPRNISNSMMVLLMLFMTDRAVSASTQWPLSLAPCSVYNECSRAVWLRIRHGMPLLNCHARETKLERRENLRLARTKIGRHLSCPTIALATP